MTLPDWLGPAQIAALIVLAQRGAEELYSMYNTRRLLDAGAHEEGADYYSVVAVTHLGWIAAIFFLIPADQPYSAVLLALFLAVQILRYFVLATIGRFWTHHIITLPGAPLVKHGIYKFVRHPNYQVTRIETVLLPAVFHAWALSAIFGVIWWFVLEYKIKIEDAALASRKTDGAVAGGEPGS